MNTSTLSNSFFSKVDDAQRAPLLEAYLDYLHRRNGPIEQGTGRLPLREISLAEMNASKVRFAGQISQTEFDRLYAQFSASDPQLTREMLTLLLFCKMNAGEAYGVGVIKAVHARRKHQSQDLASRAILFAQEEEEYHTRILVGAAHYFNIRAEGTYTPKLTLRVLIGSLAYAPKPLFYPILYGAEVAGVFIFNWTLNRIRETLQGQPELLEAMEQRLIEVITDEIGHVAFNRLVLSEMQRKLGRSLAWMTVRGLPSMTPELGAMGFDSSALAEFDRFDLHSLPEEAVRRGFFA